MKTSSRTSTSPKAAIEIGHTVLTIAVFGVSGCVYLWIGVENLFHSLTFPGKVIGAVLFICSIVILAGAPAILRYQQLARRSDATRYQYLVLGSDVSGGKKPESGSIHTSGSFVVVAAGVSLTVSSMLLIVQTIIGQPNLWWILWLMLAPGSFLVLYRALRAGIRVPNVNRLVGGLSIALLISLTSIAYTDFYLPSEAAPLLSVSVVIKPATIDKHQKAAIIPISMVVRNSQNVGVYLLAAYYDVSGRKESMSHLSQSKLRSADSNVQKQGRPFRRFVTDKSYDLLQEGPIGDRSEQFLNPGDSFTVSDTVTIPEPTRYDAVQVAYQILIMRDDRYQLNPDFWKPGTASWARADKTDSQAKTLRYVYWRGSVSESSPLQQMLTASKMVYVEHDIPTLHSSKPYTPIIKGQIEDAATESPINVLTEIKSYGFEVQGGPYITAIPAQLKIPIYDKVKATSR
jgi:hypothetical protein